MKYNYELMCAKLVEYCVNSNIVPTIRELTTLGFPGSRWFVLHSKEEIKTYPEFLQSLNLKPHYKINKDTATRLIHKKANKLNRTPLYDDFRDIKTKDDIGIKVILSHWGSFNNMLIELGYEINKEDMFAKSKSIEELKNDIILVCEYIKNVKGRSILNRSDIDECEWCLSAGTYDKHFKKYLNMTLVEYIVTLGYDVNKSGMGTVFTFDNGETTTSKFEFDISNYLRNEQIKYERNVKYSSFSDYQGNKDCDYVINHNNKTWYVEVAGMLDYSKISKNKDDFIRRKYKIGLEDKRQILSNANLNYKIIYPSDLKDNSLSEVFAFL